MIPNQKTFIDQFFSPFLKKMLETTSAKQIFLIPGNWDLAYPYLFREDVEGIIDLDQKSYQIENGYEWIGYPFVPPTPFRPNRAIYVMHSPPFGTRLDFIQGGELAGSRSIKAFIEKHLPFLTLHGHIHESPDLSGHYFDRIGETISVNPGQSVWKGKDSLSLYAVTFEIGNVEETLRHTCF